MITSIILHYKRPGNIRRVVEGIRKQTIKSEIWIWDQSGDCPECGADVMVRSSRNFHCLPRVLLAGAVRTGYIYNQDDDLAIKSPDLFERLLDVAKHHPDAVIGFNGRRVKGEDINWEKAYSFPNKGKGGGWCDFMPTSNPSDLDMINTGVSFLRTALINQIKLNPFFGMGVTEKEYKYGDDMVVSAQLDKKRVAPFNMKMEYDWLAEGMGLSKQEDHMKVRDSLMCRYWGPK